MPAVRIAQFSCLSAIGLHLVLQEVKVAGLDAYITGVRDNPGATIVFIHDIYGWKAKNARLLADKYAAAGTRLYLGPAVLTFTAAL